MIGLLQEILWKHDDTVNITDSDSGIHLQHLIQILNQEKLQ